MRFTQIATIFAPTQATLAIMALEQGGFAVIAPGLQLIQVTPHRSLALGGIPIFVPADQAADALEYLHAIQSGTIINLDQDEKDPPKDPIPDRSTGIRHFYHALVYWLFGASNPLKGWFID